MEETVDLKSDSMKSNITYNPALDYLEEKIFFKEKVDRAREFIKKYGLPERFMQKNNS